MEFEIVIGLEVHAELKTKSKIFCGCKNEFGSQPNTNCCSVCTAMPGALPVLNKKAVELCIKAGMTVGCDINDIAIFERKNYFYPDLSKAYQISQLAKPICINGKMVLANGKEIRINRIHLEEDAGKLIHTGKTSIIDYNRGGVPLIELVTEPDFRSKEEVSEFLVKLRNNYIFAGVADCKMEEGGLRCDVNVSVREKGAKEFGTRTEMKNLNSFKSVERAIEYESERQIELAKNNQKVIQQTRRWDDNLGESFAMRDKENSNDYRYFPDPDLLAVKLERSLVEKFRSEMPKSSEELKSDYINNLKLTEYEANVLTSDFELCVFFNKIISEVNNPKMVTSFVLNDISGFRKNSKEDKLPEVMDVIYIIKLVNDGKISRTLGTTLFKSLILENKNPKGEVERLGLLLGVADDVIENIIKQVLADKPNLVEDYKDNPAKVSPFIIGQVMKATAGKANSSKVVEILNKILK